MKSRKYVASLVAALLAVAGVVFIGAEAPAQAAVGCTFASCDGKGPVTNHCDVGAGPKYYTTTPSGSYGPGELWLEYSPACHAYWARGRSLSEDRSGVAYTIRIETYRLSDGGLSFAANADVYANQFNVSSGALYEWTNMAGASSTRRLRACALMTAAEGGDGHWHCTPFFT